MSLLQPKYRFNRITDITVDDFVNMGIKAVALDVDNTLAEHNHPVALDGVQDWLEKMAQAQIKLLIVSNNKAVRVRPFADELGLDFLTRAAKPLPIGFFRFAKKMGIKTSKIAVIGDQIFTDIMGANLAGAVSILVDPVSFEDGWSFRVRRHFEKGVLLRFENNKNRK